MRADAQRQFVSQSMLFKNIAWMNVSKTEPKKIRTPFADYRRSPAECVSSL